MQNNDNLDEPILFNPFYEKPLKHFVELITVSLHHFYITGEIDDEVDRYIDMINILKTAQAHDKVYIYLNTPGGGLTTTVQIMAAINQSQAEVTTVLEGEICSAGTLIFLSGHNYVVHDNCSFMVHNYSHGAIGKGGEVAKRVKFAQEYFKDIAQSVYDGFLTPEEIESVSEDADMWMGSEEVIRRLSDMGADVVRGAVVKEDDVYDDIESMEVQHCRRKSKSKKAEE